MHVRIKIPVEPYTLRTVHLGDKTHQLRLGPADFPSRLDIETTQESVQIRFVYYSSFSESTRQVKNDNGIVFELGEISGRVMHLRVPRAIIAANQLELTIRESLKEPSSRVHEKGHLRKPHHDEMDAFRMMAHYQVVPEIVDFGLKKLRRPQTEG